MANGYDKFFKEAQKASGLSKTASKSKPQPKINLNVKAQGQKGRRETPEDRLRQELASRMRARQQQALRKKKNFPLYPVVCVAAALVACTLGYYQSDALEDLMSKVEIGVFGSASAAEPAKPAPRPAANNAAKSSATEGEKQEKAAAGDAAAAKADAPNTKGWTPEELSFFSKLNERKKELDHREAELSKLEEELQKRKAELDEKIKQLETMRAEISKTLKSRVAEDQTKVDKLVQFYSTMKPQQAAKIIETLNEDLAVEVLDKMKKKNAAEILDMMNAKKARRLSELLTGYQRTTASAEPSEEDQADAKKK